MKNGKRQSSSVGRLRDLSAWYEKNMHSSYVAHFNGRCGEVRIYVAYLFSILGDPTTFGDQLHNNSFVWRRRGRANLHRVSSLSKDPLATDAKNGRGEGRQLRTVALGVVGDKAKTQTMT